MSGLRQAALMTLVFLVVLVTAGVFAFGELQRELNQRAETELRARFTVIATDIHEDGFSHEDYPNTGLEFVLFEKNGKFSNIDEFHEDDFFRGFRGRDRDRYGDHGDWLYVAGAVEGGRLIVGTNVGRRDEFTEVALQTLGFVGGISAVVAAILGLIFGFRNQRRISRISNTLGDVAGGDLNARVGIKSNRDDLDALGHRVDETTAKLDVLMRQSRDFSANIAHDLKTPLARLRLRLETALVAETETGDSVDEIGSALEQTDKVIGIFDAFLRIAKLESGATKADFADVDLAEIAEEMIDVYGAVVEDSGRTLLAEVSGPTVVRGDRVLLIQMLANMIENALRHTPEGTVLRLVAQNGILGLADNGPGIPADEVNKVTQPLYRLEKSRTTEGAGLGLSLVKTIAELHGAALKLSEPEGGQGLFIRAEFGESV